jgi:hypothetical protein
MILLARFRTLFEKLIRKFVVAQKTARLRVAFK